MISAVDFWVFSSIILVMALLSVYTKHTLYAVLCHIQVVLAFAGLFVGVNSRFMGFALLSMSATSFLVFLLFALVVFDFKKSLEPPARHFSLIFKLFFMGSFLQLIWFFYHAVFVQKPELALDFSLFVLGEILYSKFGLSLLVFGLVFLSCIVGLITLLGDQKQDSIREQSKLNKEHIL